MRFLVRRTSDWGDSKPCDEAIPTKYIYYDRRTVDAPEKLRYHNAVEDWYSRGENHRVENGWIVRDIHKDNGWSVDINSIEDMSRFVERNGCVVLTEAYGCDFPEIEIYDDYRE